MLSKRKLQYFTAITTLLILLWFTFISNLSLRLLFADKIWAHRANSIEKMQAACQKYTGIELDVVFVEKGGYFDVSHPPDPLSNLSLEDYLNKICVKDLNIWLDFKNLNKSNVTDRTTTRHEKGKREQLRSSSINVAKNKDCYSCNRGAVGL